MHGRLDNTTKGAVVFIVGIAILAWMLEELMG